MSRARTDFWVRLLDPARPTNRLRRRFSDSPAALALSTTLSTAPSQARPTSRASVRSEMASSGVASTRPGTTPAMKSAPIDEFVDTAYITITMDGGMRMPRPPDEATMPAPKRFG